MSMLKIIPYIQEQGPHRETNLDKECFSLLIHQNKIIRGQVHV